MGGEPKISLGIKVGGENYKVVVIDDSKTIRMMLKQMLLSEKFDIYIEAEDGAMACEKIKEATIEPEIIFCDVDMPNMNGIEFAKEVKNLAPKAKLIMATSHADGPTVQELVKIGIAGYIVKPFDRQKVMESIAKVIGRVDYLPKFLK